MHIDKINARDVIKAGADGIAVISAIVSAEDIAATTLELKTIVRTEREKCET